MAKTAPQFTCSECGAAHKKWSGRCEACGAWNSIVEEAPLSAGPATRTLGGAKGRVLDLTTLATEETPPRRAASGMGELDRVLGGGPGGRGGQEGDERGGQDGSDDEQATYDHGWVPLR